MLYDSYNLSQMIYQESYGPYNMLDLHFIRNRSASLTIYLNVQAVFFRNSLLCAIWPKMPSVIDVVFDGRIYFPYEIFINMKRLIR